MKTLTLSALALVLCLPAFAQETPSADATGTVIGDSASARDEIAPVGSDVASAGEQMPSTTDAEPIQLAGLARSSQITGLDVYAIDTSDDDGWFDLSMTSGIGPNWTDVGEISDVVFDPTGKIVGLVADIGGFLEMGEKHVILDIQDVRFVRNEAGDAYSAVARVTQEELDAMPDYVEVVD